jgi:hypothetical protein
MKTYHVIYLLTIICSGAFAVTSRADSLKTIAVVDPNAETASAKWSEIKDCTYDMRALFFAGFKQLESTVDEQLNELKTKRAAMKSSIDTSEWDFAMKEMQDARAYLTSTGNELHKANPKTWDQQREKVGQAWIRSQEAYKKVKSSTTT